MKETVKNKKMIIGVIVALLMFGSIGGYFLYDNNRKNEIMEKMVITFTDMKEVEYGTKDYDVKKELIKEIKNCELSGDVPKLDTTKVGETKLVFKLSKSDVTKEVEHTIKIVDTKAPEISLEADSKELTVGDKYDLKSNIKSVADIVDGDISLDDKAIEVNKNATEEYSKLKKEDISNNETKIADHKLDDFFVETIKSEESGEKTTQLYLKNCYYIDGSVDTSKAGEYTVNVIAIDKNGLKSTKEFVVNVKEKEKPVVSNGGGSGSSSGGGSVSRGSIQDVINTAYSIGNVPYISGGVTASGVDCNGYIYYAYTQNGYNIPSNVAKAGYQVAYYPAGTGLDPNIIRAGDIIITEGTDFFGKYRYHAQLATGGDTYCAVGGTGSSSGLYDGTKIYNITVRRIV